MNPPRVEDLDEVQIARLRDAFFGQVIDPPEVGSSVLLEWRAKLAQEVRDGMRSASSLSWFTPEAATDAKERPSLRVSGKSGVALVA